MADQQRARNLKAALPFLRLPATEPELNLRHRVFDSWSGLGLMTVGAEHWRGRQVRVRSEQ